MKTNDPIFVIGAPRSGTTFFHEVFSSHPDVCTITAPDITKRYRFLLEEICTYSPLITNSFKKIFSSGLTKVEGTSLWKIRLVDESDVLTEEDSSLFRDFIIKNRVKSYVEYYDTEYFLAKDCGLSFKIRYMNRIFPGSKFIHLIRDGRAVVNSAKKVWKNYPKIKGWWGPKPKNWKKILKENDDLIKICAKQWAETIRYIKENKGCLDGRYKEIKYSELIENFEDIVRGICDFTGLNFSNNFEEIIQNFEPKNMNWKWKEQLSNKDKQKLREDEDFQKVMSLI